MAEQTIKIQRINFYSIGTRMWYVVQDEEGIVYQRWSSIMDATDEVLFLAQKGDTLSITYVVEPHSTLDAFSKSELSKKCIMIAKAV